MSDEKSQPSQPQQPQPQQPPRPVERPGPFKTEYVEKGDQTPTEKR
jgi:hypothetical protein